MAGGADGWVAARTMGPDTTTTGRVALRTRNLLTDPRPGRGAGSHRAGGCAAGPRECRRSSPTTL